MKLLNIHKIILKEHHMSKIVYIINIYTYNQLCMAILQYFTALLLQNYANPNVLTYKHYYNVYNNIM